MTVIISTSMEQDYEQFKSTMTSFKDKLNTAITYINSHASTGSDMILSSYSYLGKIKGQLVTFISIPGITSYAATAEGDPTYDVVFETQAVITAIGDATDWLDTNFPSYNGYLLNTQIFEGSITYRTFTEAQLSDYVTALGAIVALIG